MPQLTYTEVFTFDELTDDRAKDRARDWYREGQDNDFTDFLYEDFETVAGILGVRFSTHAAKLMGGSTRRDPDIYWSGFSTQGDGLDFAGDYRHAKGASKAIRAHAPQDTELHRIADSLTAIQRKYFYKLTASIGNSHQGHWLTVEVDTEHGNNSAADTEDVTELLRDFAAWMYSQLEQEYEYQNSDECVDENIRGNEYTFTEDGRRFG